MPRAKAGADSVLGAEQSSGGADLGYSRELDSEGGRPAAATETPGCGGPRRLDSRDRSGLNQPLLGSSYHVQGDPVGQTQADVQVQVQAAECPPPTVR